MNQAKASIVCYLVIPAILVAAFFGALVYDVSNAQAQYSKRVNQCAK